MEITSKGQKLVLSVDSKTPSIRIPVGFEGRFFIDIDGKASEITQKDALVIFQDVKADSNIGYGWSAK